MVEFLFWCAVGCCAVAQVAIVRSAFVAREGVGTDVPHPRRRSEIAWTVLPALGLAVALFFTWRAIHADRPLPPRIGAITMRTGR